MPGSSARVSQFSGADYERTRRPSNEALQQTARNFGSGLLAALAAAIVGDAPQLNAGR